MGLDKSKIFCSRDTVLLQSFPKLLHCINKDTNRELDKFGGVADRKCKTNFLFVDFHTQIRGNYWNLPVNGTKFGAFQPEPIKKYFHTEIPHEILAICFLVSGENFEKVEISVGKCFFYRFSLKSSHVKKIFR